MMKNLWIRVIQLLSISGFVLSFYLLLSKVASEFFCPIGDCLTVNNSKFAQIGPVPVSLMGVFFYATILILMELTRNNSIPLLDKTIKILTLSGFLFSFYLTLVELFILHAICFWCMLSFIIVIAINVIYWFELLKTKVARFFGAYIK